MRSSTILIASAAVVAAESFNALLPGFDPQPLVAKSIGGGGDVTTYVLGCKADIGSEDCGLPYPVVYVAGPKTAVFTLERSALDEDEGDFSYEQLIDCSVAGTTLAVCTMTVEGAILTNTYAQPGDGRPLPSSIVTTMSGSDIADAFVTVQIVKETASIMNYGTDAYGKPTKYDGAAEAVETGSGKESGIVTSKATLPSQTGTAAQSGMTSVVSEVNSAASDAASSSTSTGIAAQVTGLGAFALAAIAGIMGVAAL